MILSIIRNFFKKDDKYLNIADQFSKRYEELDNEIHTMKKTNPDLVAVAESYLIKTRHSIDILKKTQTEKDAIETLHLFYCLDEEMSIIKGQRMNFEFRSSYGSLLSTIQELKKKGIDTSSLAEDLMKIDKMLSIPIASEKYAIDTLHLFYCVQDRIKELGEAKPSMHQANELDDDEKKLILDYEKA
jgi:hypothetical protein